MMAGFHGLESVFLFKSFDREKQARPKFFLGRVGVVTRICSTFAAPQTGVGPLRPGVLPLMKPLNCEAWRWNSPSTVTSESMDQPDSIVVDRVMGNGGSGTS